MTLRSRYRLHQFGNRLQVFFLGLLLGIVLSGGFFLLKLDDYVKDLALVKSFTDPEKETPEEVTDTEEAEVPKTSKRDSDKPAGNLTANICNQPLVVNGPVSANALHVYRTAGATKTNPEEPAETFRLTPTTYLWAFDFTNQADRVKTTYVTEEAPRF